MSYLHWGKTRLSSDGSPNCIDGSQMDHPVGLLQLVSVPNYLDDMSILLDVFWPLKINNVYEHKHPKKKSHAMFTVLFNFKALL